MTHSAHPGKEKPWVAWGDGAYRRLPGLGAANGKSLAVGWGAGRGN